MYMIMLFVSLPSTTMKIFSFLLSCSKMFHNFILLFLHFLWENVLCWKVRLKLYLLLFLCVYADLTPLPHVVPYLFNMPVCICVQVCVLSARSGSHLGHTGAVVLHWLHHRLDLVTRPLFFSGLTFCVFPIFSVTFSRKYASTCPQWHITAGVNNIRLLPDHSFKSITKTNWHTKLSVHVKLPH